ncbi:MAG: complex I NDUFA9 subunit family protein [Burkholderiaceae bacterium]
MTYSRILVVGGSGFIGRHLVAKLAAEGRQVRVPTRRMERAKHLISLPRVEVVETDIQAPGVALNLLQDVDAVVNLVGILHGPEGGPDWGRAFDRAHVQLPRLLGESAVAAGVRRMVHMSALGVTDAPGQALPSRYLRSKAAGEACLKAIEGLQYTFLRPSVVYGADDAFINLFARLQRLLPVIALAGAQARLAPIWVEDVAQAAIHLLDASDAVGRAFELAGPDIVTLQELVELAGLWSGHSRPVIALPDLLARPMAGLMECLPGEPLMSRDNLDSLKLDNVPSGPIDALCGIVPRSLREAGPSMYGGSTMTRLSRWREQAHR